MAGHDHSLPPKWEGGPENDVKRATERMEPGSLYDPPNELPPGVRVDVFDDYFSSDDFINLYNPWRPPQMRQRSSTSAPQTYQTIRRTNPELDPYDPPESITGEPPRGPLTRHLKRRRSFVRAREEPLDIHESQYPSAAYHQAVAPRPNDFYYESPPGPHSHKYAPPHDEMISGMQLASDEESLSRKEGVGKSLRDDSKPVREEVTSAKKDQAQGIPSGARWTKINRRLVSPEVLEASRERFEERSDHIIVLRVLSKEEIEEYALRTRELRDGLKVDHSRKSTSGRVQHHSLTRIKKYWSEDGRVARDESSFPAEVFEMPGPVLRFPLSMGGIPSLSRGPRSDTRIRQGTDNSRVPIDQSLRQVDDVKDGEKERPALNEPAKPSTPTIKSESPSSSVRSEETNISSPDVEDDSIDSEISSMKDMSHLLDSSRYFSELDNLEVRTAEILGLKGSPNLILNTIDDCLLFCKSWHKAFVNLTSEGFCGSQISFLVEDTVRNDISNASHVSLIQINHFIEVFEGFFKSLDERRITKVTTKFLRSILRIQDDDLASVDLIASLRILCQTLAIGLLSFTGSHVCRFDLNLWDREIDEIGIGYEGYAFKPRKLACLEDLIGGPAWILSKARTPSRTHEQLGESQDKELAQEMQNLATRESSALDNEQSGQRKQGMKISITLQDLQELWGPALLVGGTEEEAPVIRTERGFIVPLTQQPESSKHGIECHWASEIPDLLFRENSDNPIMLQSTSKILIGTPSENEIGLVVNKKCKSSIPLIQQQIASRLQYPGTSKSRYVSDGFEIQLTAGQYATAGLVKKYKRLPNRTLKAMLIEDCPKPDTKLVPLLNLWVGLEVSACTGNAQRVKLWDALRLSQADVQSKENTSGCSHAVGSKECIDSCWTKWQSDDEIDSLDDIPGVKKHLTGAEARRIIIHSILALEHSGVDNEGILQVCWPFSHSPANCAVLPSSPRELHHWFRVVKDSRDTSSFAVFSQRCLEFSDQSFCVPCKNKHVNSSRQTILATRILSFAEHRPFAGLLQGVKFVVGEAHLTVTKVLRDHAAVIAAISVNPLSPLRYRLREILPASGSDSGVSGFKEHILPDITTDLSVPVFAY
ncbi:hypothetical protein N7493_003205 [Penicillium malachiteum]|uniref:DUF8035 domain-containing protein n=1 Tax=Penicillium malachiteum TaxID=1324776 RepID=A0AAD6HTD8_9EURO|nr:hypothetical protein N7493_003205 [Penicillium malachiteum]